MRAVVQCARCGHACPVEAWRALPRQHALARDDLARLVSDWPEGLTVEVRACRGCGGPVARLTRPVRTAAPAPVRACG